jgi:hypothetical protein
MVESRAESHREVVRPSDQDLCAECGRAVRNQWVLYRQNPEDPHNLFKHFGGIIKAGPAEPRPELPKQTIRGFRYPEDLDVFFHSSCAPSIKLSESVEKELARLFADAIIAAYEKTLARWAKVRPPLYDESESDPPRCHAHIANVRGRRVFTMVRGEWARLRDHEGRLVEIDLTRTPSDGVEEPAAMIASLAADCPIHATRMEVWPYNENDQPKPSNLQDYLVLENLTRRINLPMFAERASTQDSLKLRKHLRDHVFIVSDRLEKGRREAKARALERIVFMTI